MAPKKPVLNIAAYRFVLLQDDMLQSLRAALHRKCTELGLKGTILLSQEGINLVLSGIPAAIEQFWNFLTGHSAFSDMDYKASESMSQPFQRMLVKIKKEIITLDKSEIRPADYTGPYISSARLKEWLDKGKDFTLLDTRNVYEVKIGSFAKAKHLNIESFRNFPEAIQKLDQDLKQKPVVMFCTGGIRCEKASPLMLNSGFSEVYQLEGGILRYFEEVGSDHFFGDCFVFDQRIALDGNLTETGAVLCDNCQMPVSRKLQQTREFKAGEYCPWCVEVEGEDGR